MGWPPVGTVRRAVSATVAAVVFTAVADSVSRVGHGANGDQPRADSADAAASAERAGDPASTWDGRRVGGVRRRMPPADGAVRVPRMGEGGGGVL